MSDQFGLQRPEQRSVERFASEPAWEEQITDDAPAEPEVEAESPALAAPDFTDTKKWVKVERPEVTVYIESDGEDRPEIKRYMLTGRLETYYRARTEEDGDAAVVRERANIPAPPDRPRMERHKWFDPETGPRRGKSAAQIRAEHDRENNAPRLGSFTPGSLIR